MEDNIRKKLYNRIYWLKDNAYEYIGTLQALRRTVKSKEDWKPKAKGEDKIVVLHLEALLRLVDKHSISEKEYSEIYEQANRDTWDKYWPKRKVTGFKPYQRKDNRHHKAPLGGGLYYRGNKIRIPSRKHKNRWKNFVKLFPQYTDMYNKIFKTKK